jgi:4-amino-4-deoxy-L-arabinose transferase-like glycosyltransferase
VRVIRAQPVSYARVVARDFLHYFEPGHRIGPNDPQIAQWEFPTDPSTSGTSGYRGPIRRVSHGRAFVPNKYVGRMVDRPHTNAGASKLLHVYQLFAFTSGQILGVCVIVVLVALILRRGPLRLRLDAALLGCSVLLMLLVATALSVFSYRYGLVAVMLLPAAAALAATAMLERRRDVVT